MILVGDNKAFAAKALERCRAVSDEVQRGVLPFDRDGCFFDEVLMAAALQEAPSLMTDMPDLFEGLPGRTSAEGNNLGEEGSGEADADVGDLAGDDDWGHVADTFDDLARWDDWEVPVLNGHVVLEALLAARHPYRWFDSSLRRPTMRETLCSYLGLSDKQLAEAMGAMLAPRPKPRGPVQEGHDGSRGAQGL